MNAWPQILHPAFMPTCIENSSVRFYVVVSATFMGSNHHYATKIPTDFTQRFLLSH